MPKNYYYVQSGYNGKWYKKHKFRGAHQGFITANRVIFSRDKVFSDLSLFVYILAIKMFDETCCLLCLKRSKDQMDLDSKEGVDLTGREVIELHFKDELDMMSQFEMKFICRHCWNLVETFQAGI